MELGRWTPFTFVAPRRYAEGSGDEARFWSAFDIEEWARQQYDWTQDPWNGFLDFASRPRETIETGTGDCEDFALVAISWALAQDREGVGLAFCWEFPYPWPRHVIAFDDERVYSSGNIVETSVDEWVESSKYEFSLRRRVT